MRVRCLGNVCLEVFSRGQILIDPNFIVEPERAPEFILLTHEHDDHYDPKKCAKTLNKATLYAPLVLKAWLSKLMMKSMASKCWKAIAGDLRRVSATFIGPITRGRLSQIPRCKRGEAGVQCLLPQLL